MSDLDRPRRKVWFLFAIAVVLFGIYSAIIAGTTADDCGGAGRNWQVFPPAWECKGRPGFG
jgi:hypothetical protein